MFVIFFRTLMVYILIIVMMRLMGKRQLGELQPSELVSTILLSNLASISIESPELPLSASFLPVILIASFEILLSALCVKNRKASRLISGQPIIIVKDGIIDQNALRILRFTIDDVLEALRAKDIFDPSEVTCAIVETNGSISVYRRWDCDTPDRSDLNLSAPQAKKPMLPFISDGEVLSKNLLWCKKNQRWLDEVLKENRVGLSDVFLLMGNDTEDYTLTRKEQS